MQNDRCDLQDHCCSLSYHMSCLRVLIFAPDLLRGSDHVVAAKTRAFLIVPGPADRPDPDPNVTTERLEAHEVPAKATFTQVYLNHATTPDTDKSQPMNGFFFRVDRAKSPEISQKEGVLASEIATRNRKSLATSMHP